MQVLLSPRVPRRQHGVDPFVIRAAGGRLVPRFERPVPGPRLHGPHAHSQAPVRQHPRSRVRVFHNLTSRARTVERRAMRKLSHLRERVRHDGTPSSRSPASRTSFTAPAANLDGCSAHGRASYYLAIATGRRAAPESRCDRPARPGRAHFAKADRDPSPRRLNTGALHHA